MIPKSLFKVPFSISWKSLVSVVHKTNKEIWKTYVAIIVFIKVQK